MVGSRAAVSPAYLGLSSAELRCRVERALAELADCRACPRYCGVNRLEDRWSACKTGRYAVVSSAFPHFGEEDCLRGWKGSGTIFLAHCNLRCVFCQNFDISQAVAPGPVAGPLAAGPASARPSSAGPSSAGSRPARIAATMIGLQDAGCHNINFVTPEHVVPQIVEALEVAIGRGLSLPLVYNTSAYDSLRSLALMDGLVDIYMPDFKCWTAERSRLYLKAADYPEAARGAIAEMHRQVGPLVIDDSGLARRGLLVRHLVMPGCLDETREILTWIARELGRDTYINLMGQYAPAGRVGAGRYAEIDRRPTPEEMDEAYTIAADTGLHRLDRRRPAGRWG
jgi:putative pyruvate formate lyase activating enzyme